MCVFEVIFYIGSFLCMNDNMTVKSSDLSSLMTHEQCYTQRNPDLIFVTCSVPKETINTNNVQQECLGKCLHKTLDYIRKLYNIYIYILKIPFNTIEHCKVQSVSFCTSFHRFQQLVYSLKMCIQRQFCVVQKLEKSNVVTVLRENVTQIRMPFFFH